MSRLTIDIPTGLGGEDCSATERTESVGPTGSTHGGTPAGPMDGRERDRSRDHRTDDGNDGIDEPVRTFVSWVECWAGA